MTAPAPGSELAVALANVTAAVIGATMRGATVVQLEDAVDSGVRIARYPAHISARASAGLRALRGSRDTGQGGFVAPAGAPPPASGSRGQTL
jgi:hypothetical protein